MNWLLNMRSISFLEIPLFEIICQQASEMCRDSTCMLNVFFFSETFCLHTLMQHSKISWNNHQGAREKLDRECRKNLPEYYLIRYLILRNSLNQTFLAFAFPEFFGYVEGISMIIYFFSKRQMEMEGITKFQYFPSVYCVHWNGVGILMVCFLYLGVNEYCNGCITN